MGGPGSGHYTRKIRGPSDQTIVILELRNDGKSYGEISAITGIKKESIVHACISWGYGGFAPGKENKVVTLEEVAKNISMCGFEYVDGYKNGKSNVTVRCPKCGREFQRLYHIFRDKVNGTWKFGCECPLCKSDDRNQKAKEKAIAAEQRREERERVARINAELRKQKEEDEEAKRISRQLERRLATRVCKNCGLEYSIAATGYDSEKYCSDRCAKRWALRVKNERRSRKLLKRRRDNDLTLDRLFNRDHGICYLCGMQCDWNDGYDLDGTFIAGDNYPSIDHVIPVAKGGTHTWDNVKLACRKCNTRKGSK